MGSRCNPVRAKVLDGRNERSDRSLTTRLHHRYPRNCAVRLVATAATITLALGPQTVPSLGPKVSGRPHPSVLVAFAKVKQA